MGCFSCFPKEKRQDTEGGTQGKKRCMNCFSCFPGQYLTERNGQNTNCFSCFSSEDSTERKRRNTNCFSCFQAQSMTQEKTRKVNCFSCFQRQKSTQAKKDTTQGKTLETNLIQEKTIKENCLPCFTAQGSAQVKTKRKRRNMNCFSCSATKSKIRNKKSRRFGNCHCLPFPFKNKKRVGDEFQDLDVISPKRAKRNNQSDRELKAKKFTFKELATATKNFKEEYLLGEGGFGRVYKGKLEKTGEVVAVKQLNLEGKQGNREFLVEIMILSNLCHPHLVNLVGYCAEGEERLLVYEYMAAGSLENHLLDLPRGRQPLDWSTRIKVALHTAKGLEYLHETNNPPIIYRDLKSSNILLDKEFNAKLSDFGLAKVGPVGSNTHVSSRVMGTFGYCAPEYQKTGKLTVKSDIYSYGVVLLELITGRRAVDLTRDSEELHLVRWVEPRIKDPRKYKEVVDPLLEGNYPKTDLSQVLAIAAMCLGVNASLRPSISDVVLALDSLVQDSVPLM